MQEAPVSFTIKYKLERTSKGLWSYAVNYLFKFTNAEGRLEDTLVELGVYTFESENEAKIQAKRICKEFKEYFAKTIYELVVKELEK